MEIFSLPENRLNSTAFRQRESLSIKCFPFVGILDIRQDDFLGGAVAEDMVDVEKEIDVVGRQQDFGAEKVTTVELHGYEQTRFLKLYIADFPNADVQRFRVAQLHLGVTVLISDDMAEQDRMSIESCLNRIAQAFGIDAAIHRVDVRELVIHFVFVTDTFGIDAILRLG